MCVWKLVCKCVCEWASVWVIIYYTILSETHKNIYIYIYSVWSQTQWYTIVLKAKCVNRIIYIWFKLRNLLNLWSMQNLSTNIACTMYFVFLNKYCTIFKACTVSRRRFELLLQLNMSCKCVIGYYFVIYTYIPSI